MSQGLTGITQATARQASTVSATTLTLPDGPMDATYPITGTNTITSITAGQAGRKATLEFQSANCTVVNGSNIKLAGRSFISTVLRTLDLESDGTNWIERTRGGFGTTLPVAQSFGDVASAGTTGEFADIGHVHGIPSLPHYHNAVDNGDLGRWRRGTSFAAIVNAANFADGWQWQSGVAAAAVVTVAQSTSLPPINSTAINAVYAAKMTIPATPDTSIAITDNYAMVGHVYGYDLRPLTNGMALSFQVRAHRTGTYCIALINSGSDRSYVAEYAISFPDTWQYITLVIPAPPTTGTWDYTTGTGLALYFVLAAGSNYQGSAGSWTSTSKIATSNQVNGVGATTDTFELALVNLIPGSTPQPCQPAAYAIIGPTDTPLPSTAAFNDGAGRGAGPQPALVDHVHGMPNHNVATNVHGLPANVNVLGNRAVSGEFIQRGAVTVTWGAAGGALTIHRKTFSGATFAVAFSSTPVIVCGGDNSNGTPLSVVAASTTSFGGWGYDENTVSFNGSVHYIALGT